MVKFLEGTAYAGVALLATWANAHFGGSGSTPLKSRGDSRLSGCRLYNGSPVKPCVS
jgi:hypothetical protein